VTRLVALDTSSVWGGVALLEGVPGGGSRLVAEAGLLLTDSHAAHVLALLEALLAEAGWPRSELDGYAAARGPGSFTGIRMALGTVRGLGLASSRPCLGIGTLDAMAEAFGPAEGERVPVLPAGRGDFFAARFDPVASPPATVVEPWLGPPSLILEGGRGEPVVFGPGAQSAVAALGGGGGWRGIARRAPTSVAAAVGRLALARLEGGARDGEGLSPLYLRPPDAELPR
jgi:tRNA threonylcarbamoyladenosine biosynthesis protein TsaB